MTFRHNLGFFRINLISKIYQLFEAAFVKIDPLLFILFLSRSDILCILLSIYMISKYFNVSPYLSRSNFFVSHEFDSDTISYLLINGQIMFTILSFPFSKFPWSIEYHKIILRWSYHNVHLFLFGETELFWNQRSGCCRWINLGNTHLSKSYHTIFFLFRIGTWYFFWSINSFGKSYYHSYFYYDTW